MNFWGPFFEIFPPSHNLHGAQILISRIIFTQSLNKISVGNRPQELLVAGERCVFPDQFTSCSWGELRGAAAKAFRFLWLLAVPGVACMKDTNLRNYKEVFGVVPYLLQPVLTSNWQQTTTIVFRGGCLSLGLCHWGFVLCMTDYKNAQTSF